jgi:uncharacterized protein
MSNQEKLKQITDKIVKEYKPEKIILFGSWAWGKPGPDSDVDLFIVKETKNTRETAKEIDGSIFPRPFPIDIIVYTPSELEQSINQNRNLFIEDIVRNGQTLYIKRGYTMPILHKPAELIK